MYSLLYILFLVTVFVLICLIHLFLLALKIKNGTAEGPLERDLRYDQ